jgi:hypothetical protein
MLSPSPTQQPPSPLVSEKSNGTVPARKRPGQSPTARVLKAIFRPILKGLYYTIRFLGSHKLVTFLVLVLLLVSAILTSYLVTKQTPFGIGDDQFQLHVNGKAVAGGDVIKNWLYHLREGNVTALQLDDKNISQPPDASQLVTQFSQPKGNLDWKDINVIASYGQSDTSVDTFVNVIVASRGPGGATNATIIFHFVTVAQGSNGTLLAAEPVASRGIQ